MKVKNSRFFHGAAVNGAHKCGGGFFKFHSPGKIFFRFLQYGFNFFFFPNHSQILIYLFFHQDSHDCALTPRTHGCCNTSTFRETRLPCLTKVVFDEMMKWKYLHLRLRCYSIINIPALILWCVCSFTYLRAVCWELKPALKTTLSLWLLCCAC